MNIRKIVGFFSATLVFTAYAQIQTAGNLLIDVTAASLSGLTNNAVISAWSNAGTLGGNFIPAVSGQGARYQTNVAGIAAVTFAGSANSVMTNTVPPPSTILSNAVWSAELWVLNPTLQSPEDQFCWTDRGNWTGSSAGRCMEIRYCADAANAVEHYDSAYNIQWSGNPPLAGLWHHMVITRDASGVERLYADGVLRTTKTPPSLNLREGAPFAMGGVCGSCLAELAIPLQRFVGNGARSQRHVNDRAGGEQLHGGAWQVPVGLERCCRGRFTVGRFRELGIEHRRDNGISGVD